MTQELAWTKDPEASLRFGFDAVDLLADGDFITGVTIEAQDGVTATDPQSNGTVIFCRVAGGAAGSTGTVVLRWTTAQSDVDERTLTFTIEDQ